MKILITGATGKIGSKLVSSLKKDYDLILLTRNIPSDTHGLRYFSVNLDNKEKLDEIFKQENPDVVIHLAAALPTLCNADQDEAERTNVQATKFLGELASKYGVGKFIFTSTAGVYNQTKYGPTKEVQNIHPLSVYAQTKYSAEQQLKHLSSSSEVQFVVLRLFNVYGAGFTDSLIYKLLHSNKKEPITLLGPRNYYRDYIYIDDVLEAFKLTIQKSFVRNFTVLNIASGKAISNSDIISILKENDIQPHYESKECIDTISWADISLAKKELNFQPRDLIIVKD